VRARACVYMKIFIEVLIPAGHFLQMNSTVRGSFAEMRITVTHCNTLQHTATLCNTLQRTATHCNSFAPQFVAPLLKPTNYWALLRKRDLHLQEKPSYMSSSPSGTHYNTLQLTATLLYSSWLLSRGKAAITIQEKESYAHTHTRIHTRTHAHTHMRPAGQFSFTKEPLT